MRDVPRLTPPTSRPIALAASWVTGIRIGDSPMRYACWLLVPVLLSVALPSLAQEPQGMLRRDEYPPAPQEPIVSTRLTPELWLYEQERIRMDDPAQAVRRKAEIRGIQRAERLASLKWYGFSNSRPTISNVTPMLGGFAAPTWTSNTYDPNRWRPMNPPYVVR
jgi:hypothetical protein